MRRVCYSVAMSLDGFIADPKGGYDWIVIDPGIDFEAMFKGYDTVLMGRKSYDAAKGQGVRDAGSESVRILEDSAAGRLPRRHSLR